MLARSPSPLPGAARQNVYAPSPPATQAASAAGSPPPPPSPQGQPGTTAEATTSVASALLKRRREGDEHSPPPTVAPKSNHRLSGASSAPLAARKAGTPASAAATRAPAAPALLDIHPLHRSEQGYRAWFQAGGRLASIPEAERDERCCRIAIEVAPRSLADVPLQLRSVALCREAVRRDGYALTHVPKALLDADPIERAHLCRLAYESPRPPRIRDVPQDQRTQARCIQSLQWAPLDLTDIPEPSRSTSICLAAVRFLPTELLVPLDDIPKRVLNEQLAIALIRHSQRPVRSSPEVIVEWLPPELRTEAVLKEYILAEPLELRDKKWQKKPVPLAFLAEILMTAPMAMRRFTTQAIADVFIQSARAEGYRDGQVLPTGLCAQGLLPASLSEHEVMRWAIALSDEPSLDDVRESLRGDEAICSHVLRRGKLQELSRMKPALAARHLDILALRVRQNPELLPLMPAGIYRHLDCDWIDQVCMNYLAKSPHSPVLGHINTHGYQRLDWGVIRALSTRHSLPAPASAAPPAKHDAATLGSLPEGERTLERCERAVGADSNEYRFVPERYRSWPLLRTALQANPGLLLELPAREVKEADCLRAIAEVGVAPSHIPAHVRNTPSFQAALEKLPRGPYNKLALHGALPEEFDVAPDDAETIAWIETLLAEDPRRVFDIERWVKTEWALTAYRLGASLNLIELNLDPASSRLADFLAEIGPFTPTQDSTARPARPAGAPGGRTTSSSSSAAAARPF